jgi:hypothetical protein
MPALALPQEFKDAPALDDLEAFLCKKSEQSTLGAGCSVATRKGGAGELEEVSLLGMLMVEEGSGGEGKEGKEQEKERERQGEEGVQGSEAGGAAPEPSQPQALFLNVHEPFCMVTLGVQGAGKSHTLACVLEACLLPLKGEGLKHLRRPMMSLVLHYDQSSTSPCEATGLAEASGGVAGRLPPGAPPACLPRERLVVLVSPTNFKQRLAFYGGACEVRPLLLSWASLTADHIKRIMRIGEEDNQLYVATMLSTLRDFQRSGSLPRFDEFLALVKDKCSVKGQEGPLKQRLELLENLVAESGKNAELSRLGHDLGSTCAPGRLVVVDLTDPLLPAAEANGIFQVLVEHFRTMDAGGCGKVLGLDEAHKFMDASSAGGDGLSRAIVDCARLMRHDGLRLLVSTQSPLALAPELLELTSLCVMHRFHSADWHSFLAKKLPLTPTSFQRIRALQPGAALLYASRAALTQGQKPNSALVGLQMRNRITADRGATRGHSI